MRRHLFQLARMSDTKPALPADMTALLAVVGAKRDRAAFEILFSHFAPRVKSYLLRGGAGMALADDLVQEAMLTIWRKAEMFDPTKASASTWIFTIARNLRIDAIRRERRPQFDPSDPALVPEDEAPPDAQMVRDGEDARVRDALTDLSAEQAQVIQMSFFAEKTHSQIARELGLPLGTVKSRLRLAMARIKSALDSDT
ncbi:MAG: sigma-70 family RNA polymerase sigma factor [Rhizomicrobium sp.]